MLIYSVAGIRFELTLEERLFLAPPEPAMAPFFHSGTAGHATDRIRVSIGVGAIPELSVTEAPIFDSGRAWRIYRSENGYRIRLQPEGVSVPFWEARFAPGNAAVDIRCHPSMRDGKTGQLHNPLRYPLDQILLMCLFVERDGLILHAAGAASRKGGGWAFCGVSGAGKTTIARRLQNENGVRIFSDDRVVIRSMDNEWRMKGTPWPGDAGIAENADAPLAGIFFLERAQTTRARPLTASEALHRLLPVASIPWYDRSLASAGLAVASALLRSIPAYRLEVNPDADIIGALDRLPGADITRKAGGL